MGTSTGNPFGNARTAQTRIVGDIPLPEGAATEAGLGTDGANPPALAGTGVRGWLRALFERLADGNQKTQVTNFPSTQAVSAASLPLPSGAAQQATLASAQANLSSLDAKALDLTGTYKRYSAVSGTVSVLTGERVMAIGASAPATAAASFTFLGVTTTIPLGKGVSEQPNGTVAGPLTITFTGTDAYLVTVLSG